MLLEIIERFISQEGAISDSHDQEKCRIVVDELLVFSTCRIKHNIVSVAVVLHPSLAEVVNSSPSAAWHSL